MTSSLLLCLLFYAMIAIFLVHTPHAQFLCRRRHCLKSGHICRRDHGYQVKIIMSGCAYTMDMSLVFPQQTLD